MSPGRVERDSLPTTSEKQSGYINSEPRDTQLAQANPNIQFKMLSNDNQMSKTYVSAVKPGAEQSAGGYAGHQWDYTEMTCGLRVLYSWLFITHTKDGYLCEVFIKKLGSLI